MKSESGQHLRCGTCWYDSDSAKQPLHYWRGFVPDRLLYQVNSQSVKAHHSGAGGQKYGSSVWLSVVLRQASGQTGQNRSWSWFKAGEIATYFFWEWSKMIQVNPQNSSKFLNSLEFLKILLNSLKFLKMIQDDPSESISPGSLIATLHPIASSLGPKWARSGYGSGCNMI